MSSRLLAAALALGAAFAQTPQPAELIHRGLAAYRESRYADAAALLEQAIAAEPNNADARLYLGTAYLSQWVPGAQTPENADLARRAREQFEAAVAVNPKQESAMASLAFLAYGEGQAASEPFARNRAFDEAERWHRRVLEVDPKNRSSWYSLGVIAWLRAYPEFMSARSKAGMQPQDPGPLRDFNARSDLSNRFSGPIAEGLGDLERALAIDPQYHDALAYMNLLYRLRADLADSSEQYYRDVARADEFVNKALELRRQQAQPHDASAAPAPPPPPGAPTSGPLRIRVGGNVQAMNLIHKVAPQYPQQAKDSRIQGTVRYTVVIGRDGRIQDVQLVSGHPLLVPAATEAVKQWVYKPTLLNGQPVEVVTQIDINFTLSQ